MSYSIESLAADCYEGTSVLINKLDIRNEKELNDYESFVTGFKMIYLLQQNMKPNFDFEDYKAIHRELFSDLYEWAGTTRNLNLSKQGTNFCSYEKIDDLGNRIFSRLKRLNYLVDLERDKFVCEIADLYDTINRLHPFREGNGRTQRVFFIQLVSNAGYSLDYSAMDSDRFMIATIYASQGVIDGLVDCFNDLIK